jgi:hypothetical protein
MLAARVEPKNGPKENKKTGDFKPVVFDEYQTGVDSRWSTPPSLIIFANGEQTARLTIFFGNRFLGKIAKWAGRDRSPRTQRC